MRDPFEEMRKLSAGLSVDPLPAAEVRRRGDRMRRRRTAFSAVGAAAAVAVIASGGLFVSHGLTSTTPQPGPATRTPGRVEQTLSPSPSPSPVPGPAPEQGWVTEIPADFPLTAGLPEPGGDVPERVTSEHPTEPLSPVACGDRPTETPQGGLRTDSRRVEVSPPDAREWRHLILFQDAEAAQQAYDQVRSDVVVCAEQSPVGDSTEPAETRWSFSERTEDGVTVGQSSGLSYAAGSQVRVPGRSLAEFVRVGNALLVARLDDASSAVDTDEDAADLLADVDTVVAAMCVFALDACEPAARVPAPVESEPTVVTPEPAPLPAPEPEPVLTKGNLATAGEIPTLERAGAWRATETTGVPTLACQPARLSSLGPVESLFREFRTAGAEGPLAETNTAVLLFGDEASAASAFETVLGWVHTCENRLDESRKVLFEESYDVGPALVDADGRWREIHLSAPEVCTDCDAVWFTRQGVALLGDRLVVVSQGIATGPLEPHGLRLAMNRTMRAAVQAARA